MKDILIRDAVEGDARALAEVCIMAGHGVMELFYEGLVPGKSVTVSYTHLTLPTNREV